MQFILGSSKDHHNALFYWVEGPQTRVLTEFVGSMIPVLVNSARDMRALANLDNYCRFPS